MKWFKYMCLLGSILTIRAYAATDYFCFSSGGSNILLVPVNVLKLQEVKYYPYLKTVKLSKVVKTDYGDDDGFKPQIFYTMNEMINHKVTGYYRFLVQGYLIEEVSYFNDKTKQHTAFFRLSSERLRSEKISCI